MTTIARAIARLNIALGIALLPSGGVQTIAGAIIALFGAAMWHEVER